MIHLRNCNVILRVLVVGMSTVSATFPTLASAADGPCPLVLTPDTLVVNETAILNESHSLKSLIAADPKENLAVQHPTIIMNAFQRVAAWIHSAGVKEIPSPNYGGSTIKHYSLFSDGSEASQGKRIIGQYSQIQEFVDYIMAGANRDGAASKMPIFAGPPGTGKSEFLTIMNNVAQYLTAAQPDHYIYTFEWVNLHEIESLHNVLSGDYNETGKLIKAVPVPTALSESPLAVLPKAYQKPVIKAARDRAVALSQAEPTPVTELNPQSEHIRNEILKEYMAKHKLASLTPDQELEALDKYVVIKRKVIGKSGDIAKINAEGKDVDYAGLFMQPNPMVSTSVGQNHPFSYFLQGKVLRSNGGMLQLDEFFRNTPELRDVFLEVIENRSVARGGARNITLDTVIVGASNNESIEAAKKLASGGASDGKTNSAHIDRVKIINMNYQLNPYEVGKTLLLMKNPANLLQMQLGIADANLIPASIDDLYPTLNGKSAPLGPDGRYGLYVNVGPGKQPVHLSPHVLQYLSLTVAASRLNTSAAEAAKFMPNAKVLNSPAFRDVVTRLKVLTGDLSIDPAERRELEEASKFLSEGTSGISNRDAANVWLTNVIAIAQKSGNGNCVTPSMAKAEFDRLIAEGGIQFPNNKERLRYKVLSERILQDFVLPAIQSDVNAVLGSGLGDVDAIYEEVFNELLARSIDPDAVTFSSANGEVRDINLTRLQEIFNIYKDNEGRAFAPNEVIARRASSPSKDVQHPGLRKAVESYLAKRTTETISFDEIGKAMNNEGGIEIGSKFSEIPGIMKHQHGYCPHCIKEALKLAKQAAARKQQVR